jgi:hypothetical protein
MESYGSGITSWFRRTLSFIVRSWMRPTTHGIGRVKANYLRPTGNLQPLSIPECKWENICMDLIVGLPRTSRGGGGDTSIWVIVDRLTKLAHFIPIATTYRVGQYAELYISHIVRHHGIPKTIISDRGSIFVARF